MEIPVQVQFRNMHYSHGLEQKIIEKAEKLTRFCNRITGCRVVLEARHRHHQYGVIYHVSIELTVPGKMLAVSREREINAAHKDPWVAIRDAFDAMRRQLRQHVDGWREFDRRWSRNLRGTAGFESIGTM